MKLGMIGLGNMGFALASRVLGTGHEVLGYDLDVRMCERARAAGITVVASPQDVAQHARIIWLMVPAGKAVDDTLAALLPQLQAGDIIIDGGNSKFTDSQVRAQQLAQQGIQFLDCGVSGGLQAQELGFCLMIGGDKAAYEVVAPLMKVIATHNGVCHVGPSGAGHYVKMVHNGIEYGLLQAYAEGLELLHNNTTFSALDVQKIVGVWQHGSIIRSWLLGLVPQALAHDKYLQHTQGKIAEGGTGRWAAQEAEKNKIQMPVLHAALDVRQRSRGGATSFATKLIAQMRAVFGGHHV